MLNIRLKCSSFIDNSLSFSSAHDLLMTVGCMSYRWNISRGVLAQRKGMVQIINIYKFINTVYICPQMDVYWREPIISLLEPGFQGPLIKCFFFHIIPMLSRPLIKCFFFHISPMLSGASYKVFFLPYQPHAFRDLL